jgi:hypothetical protein
MCRGTTARWTVHRPRENDKVEEAFLSIIENDFNVRVTQEDRKYDTNRIPLPLRLARRTAASTSGRRRREPIADRWSVGKATG